MLSRTASNLYWTGRYIERAYFLARLVDATARLSTLPTTYGGDPSAWSGALAAAGASRAFAERYGAPTEASVVTFLTFDPGNPASISGCIENARNNARAVRTGLTQEAWEALNGAWHEVQRLREKVRSGTDAAEFTEAVQRAVAAFDGSAQRTMLRDAPYAFLQLGSAVERADNTARLLDVKYHLLLPRDEPVGGSLDYFQWATLLRTVSALTAYRWVYRSSVKPWLVADLLIFNDQMPRSLTCCYATIVQLLDQLAATSGRRGPAHRQATKIQLQLRERDVQTVFASGLHEFLAEFIVDNNRLGAAIAEQFAF
jgi:uncharacterized alpha-E superfamily protein